MKGKAFISIEGVEYKLDQKRKNEFGKRQMLIPDSMEWYI